MNGDMNLRCSIVCCEAALEIYSFDAFPVERAATYVLLANAHRRRTDRESGENLEQARKYYLRALRVFTNEAFPSEHAQTVQLLSELEMS